MITAWKERLKKKKLNNSGSAIVLVIIALAFVGMLVAMLVYMVYYNYLMKYTDRAAKDNFYTAETALNEIQAGIVRDVSDVLMECYTDVTGNHAEESPVNQQAYFENLYASSLQTQLEFYDMYINPAVGTRLIFSVNHLENYWKG